MLGVSMYFMCVVCISMVCVFTLTYVRIYIYALTVNILSYQVRGMGIRKTSKENKNTNENNETEILDSSCREF